MKFTALLIDADVLLHRAVAKATTRVQFDEVESWEVDVKQAGAWIRQEIATYKKRLGPAARAILALGDRTANFRKELCPTYKANRTSFPKPPGFLALEGKLRAHATVVQAPRLEGDDILGILATQPREEGAAVIVSIDKDLLQVPGWNYNPDKDELQEVTPEAGVMRHLTQTLTGDRVDGYPGLPGCGPVKASKILSPPDWGAVRAAFEKAGLTEADAILQARLAWVLRYDNYDRKIKEIKLWCPPSS